MKRINKFLIFLIICIIIFSTNIVFADVGSFEDYGSSWDSGSSWSSDSWDSYDYGSSSGGSDLDLLGLFFLFGDNPGLLVIVIIVIAVTANMKRKNNQAYRHDPFYTRRPTNIVQDNIEQLEIRQNQIENKIQVNDPNFNKEELVAWSKNLFIKLQQAWTERDWSTIRTFETESLFEQHKNQLQGYINNNQINVMDRICVNYAHLYAYRQEGDKEVLTVRLNSRMQDYIIDATTKQVLKGDKETERINTYLLTFIRKNGVKTKPGTTEVNTTNCPNCGAPTSITSSGKCEYCGSVMTTGEYNWVLSNLERERKRV